MVDNGNVTLVIVQRIKDSISTQSGTGEGVAGDLCCGMIAMRREEQHPGYTRDLGLR